MNIIDIETVNQPINPAGFDTIPDSRYPVCLLGFQIKNTYDQQRHAIPSKYKPADILHFIHFPETLPVFFRGILLTPTPKLYKLAQEINDQHFNKLGNFTSSAYCKILSDNKLTCDNCSLYLRPGIYPVDSHHLSYLATDNVDINELYSDIFNNKDIPYFQSIGYIAVYILDNKSITHATNSEALLKIISNNEKNNTDSYK